MKAENTLWNVKLGDRIRLIHMFDEIDPVPDGETGTVTEIEEGKFPKIHVDWDCGRSLSMIPDLDKYEIILDEKVSEDA